MENYSGELENYSEKEEKKKTRMKKRIKKQIGLLYFNKGKAYETLGMLQEAKQDYEQAYEFAPDVEKIAENKQLSENW